MYYTNGVQNNDRTCTVFNITLYMSLCNYEKSNIFADCIRFGTIRELVKIV